MTVSIFNPSTADGFLQSSSAVDYATARTGSTLVANTTTTATTGQRLISTTYYCWLLYLDFDTSAIPDGDVISDVVLELYGAGQGNNQTTIHHAHIYDWGASLTTADWIAGASFHAVGAHVASFNQDDYTAAAYNAFTDVAFPANINKAGVTRLVIGTDRFEAGSAPTGSEWIDWQTANEANPPKLTVIHMSDPMGMSGFFGT